MNKELFNMAKEAERESAKNQGFFDGRFRSRVVKDKKRKNRKKNPEKKLSTHLNLSL